MFKFRKEIELHNYLLENFEEHFNCKLIENEHRVDSGRIDFLGETEDALYVIEIKKDAVTYETINQLTKYLDAIESEKKVIGIAAAPYADESLPIPDTGHNIIIKKIHDVHYIATTKLTINIPSDLAELLENKAKEDRRSIHNYVEHYLKYWIA